MKNKKIIPLTINLVAVIIAIMLGLSKAFETLWQQENIVDNNLSAEISEENNSAFDYSYINLRMIKHDSDSFWHKTYVAEDVIPAPENAISYQDAANIAGGAILYSNGYFRHQKQEAFVDFCLWEQAVSTDSPLNSDYSHTDHRSLTVYKYVVIEDTDFDGFTDVDIGVRIDAFTGEIYTIDILKKDTYVDDNWGYGIDEYIPVAEDKKQNLLALAKDITNLCNNKSTITHYRVYECQTHYGVILYPQETNTKITILFSKDTVPELFYYHNYFEGSSYAHLIEEYTGK